MQRRKDDKKRVLEKGESQRKDGRYVYQYTDNFGKRKSVYANALSDLRKKKKQIQKDMDDGIDTLSAEITLNELFDRFMSIKTQLANATRQNYIGLWNGRVRNNIIGRKRICDIRKSDVLYFYNSLADCNLKYSTIKSFHDIISPCLDFAVDDDILRKNPCKGCLKEFRREPERREALTISEQEGLLEFVRESRVYSSYYPLIVFMLGTAVRCGEAIGLTWGDVDFKNREISIDHQLIYKKRAGAYGFYASTPKTDAGIRVIPMTNDVYKALLEQKRMQNLNGSRTQGEIDGFGDFVFSTKHKNPIMPSAVNNALLNIVNRFNKNEGRAFDMPHISAHILRHTGCTRMAEAGMDIKVLQYIMGHSKIDVTMEVYNHVTAERKRNEVKKMNEIRVVV